MHSRITTRLAVVVAGVALAVTAAPSHASVTTDARVVGVGVGAAYHFVGQSSPTVAATVYASAHVTASPPTVVVDVSAGAQLTFLNGDPLNEHSITASGVSTGVVAPGGTVTVAVNIELNTCVLATDGGSGATIYVCAV